MCLCVSVCVCLFLRNLGDSFIFLLVEPIAGKNVGSQVDASQGGCWEEEVFQKKQ